MLANLQKLHKQIEKVSGPNRALDALIARTLTCAQHQVPEAPYTSSVDDCLRLIGSVLPGWHWHVGHGPTGILPYATLSAPASAAGAPGARVEASAPTVPLALLRATTKAIMVQEHGEPAPSRQASAKTAPARPPAKRAPTQSK